TIAGGTGAVADVDTFSFASALLPVPPFADVTALVTFVNVPSTVAFTWIEIVHTVPAVTVAPPTLTWVEPAGAFTLAAPQPEGGAGLAATDCPFGRVSLKATPVRIPLPVVTVKVSVVVPFSGTVFGK